MPKVLLHLQHVRVCGRDTPLHAHRNKQPVLPLRQQRYSLDDKGVVVYGGRQMLVHPSSRQQSILNDGKKNIHETGCSFSQGKLVKFCAFGQ
jgi:hypothetical protein